MRTQRAGSLTQGLAGAWCPSLGATGFRLLDRSGRNNHGTLTNMASTAWVTSGGKIALDFDGSNDSVNITVDLSAVVTSKNYTLSTWTKTSATNSNAYPFSLGSAASDFPVVGFRIDPGGSGRVIAFIRDNAGNFVLPGNDPPAVNNGAWNHLLVVANGSTAQVYTNGGVNGAAASIASIGTTTINRATIGALGRTSVAAYYSGQVDDSRIYNRALTAPEIQQLYVGGRGFGLLPERPRRRGTAAAAAFKAFRARRQSQLIGGGL